MYGGIAGIFALKSDWAHLAAALALQAHLRGCEDCVLGSAIWSGEDVTVGACVGAVWLVGGGQRGCVRVSEAGYTSMFGLETPHLSEFFSDCSRTILLTVDLMRLISVISRLGTVFGVSAGECFLVAGLLRGEDLPQVIDRELAIVGATTTGRAHHEIGQGD